ncbi:hypothetical protein BJG89_07365 [Staphylococcus nepalensis]|uniref:YpoC family protein n=1 Tax=Staphylococcus TaxID=1279 RepID=UPI000BC30486|nr:MULTISPECIES: hypothetical protein [Staphylococcus]ATH60070.1 hypothetical protein BJD96_07035 [Staphylococcus nepalensis]ATH65161.1 hypothetical protein BJG89_07365 [Staphylococcus nepalensis]AWI44528.1 hypothetical protein BJG88_07160 [Staphylococcus nepalensis]NWN84775.1 hypothetical protein [Staphylococcus sp.]
MISKEDFKDMELQIDAFSKQKKLKSPQAKALLDQYFDMIETFFLQINGINTIDFNHLSAYPIVPMNFEERYHYMVARKYHFMGYRQMKTLKSELIKMNASYQIRQKKKGTGQKSHFSE